MVLGPNPFEEKIPPEEERRVPPVERPLVIPPVRKPITEKVDKKEAKNIYTQLMRGIYSKYPKTPYTKEQMQSEWYQERLGEQKQAWDDYQTMRTTGETTEWTNIGRTLREEGIPIEEFEALGLTGEQRKALIKPGEHLAPTAQGMKIRGEAISTWELFGEKVVAVSEAPLFEVAGVPISAGDITALALIAFGIYQVGNTGWNMLLDKVLKKPGDLNRFGQQLYRMGMKREFSRYSRQTGREIPRKTQEEFINRYMGDMSAHFRGAVESQAQKGTLTIEMLKGATVSTYGRAVAEFNETFIPRATQTGAMVRGGLPPISPIPEEVPAVPEVGTITLFRGELTTKQEGRFYSTSKEFALEFTKSGLEEDIQTITISNKDIYKKSPLPEATSEEQMDIAINEAKEQGFKVMLVDEGVGQPDSVFIIDKEILKPPAVEVAKPPVEPITPPEPVIKEVEGVTEILASTEQKAMAHAIAKEKALITEAGKTRQQYRRLAQNITGKKSMKDMTSEEASAFIEALEKYPERKWSTKTGTWIPQPIPITKAIVPENYFNIKFGEPTPIRYFTSQNFYATKLGVGELTQPLEVAKQRLDLVFPAWSRAIDLKIKALNKVYKVTVAEKLIAFRNNLPTRASSEMALLLNKYEDLPANLVDELGTEKVALFTWFRNLSRTILNGQNQVRELLNMPPIPHREAYLRHIATETSKEIWRGNYSLPSDLAYWARRIVGKKVFNPMEMPRKMTDDLLEYFSKDLGYLTKSMIHTGLKEIYLSQPLKAFTTQLNVLSKGMMPFSSLSPTELEKAQMVSVLPASTHKWLVDYVNQVIKGQQTELDASINRVITQSGIGGVFDKFLKEFGRSIGTRPVTKMAQFSGRLVISATIGTKPRQIIRNLFQSTQNLALYGVEPTLSAFLPASKTLTRLLGNSLFLKSYARYEELPTSAMGKAERIWMWAYGKSAIFNARTAMKAAYHGTIRYIIDPKNKGLGWADPVRTYTEEKGFLYDSESEKLLREMEFGAGATQYQYIGMGMPEVFRHKTLIPVTRLQSWWMNYFFKFNREAIHRFWNGSVGWDKNLKIPWTARLNWMKYIILGGAVLTALGYSRSFGKDVLPHWGSPAAQMMVGAYNYVTADTDYKRENAKRSMYYSIKAFAPGAIDYKSWSDVWTGEKPLSSLFFYGEEWPSDMPTWGIPPLVEEVEIKKQIKYVNEEIPEFRKKLGKDIPAEDDIESYIYEMSDFGSEIRASIRDLPLERVTKEEGFSDIILMYKKAEVLWDTHYYSLPSSERQEWLQQQVPESIWTGAYLALWGKLKVTGWVSGNPQTIVLIKQLVEEFKIPTEAIPSLGELEEKPSGRPPRPVTPRAKTPAGREPTPTGGLGVNPFE